MYSPPNITGVITSRRVKMAGHETRMTEKRNAYRVLVGKRDERDHLENLIVDGRIVLK